MVDFLLKFNLLV
jgi:hypothetical protein